MNEAAVIVRGADEVAIELELTGARANDLFGIWPQIVEYLEQAEREQFETSGSRGGHPWAPLSEKWLWQKFQRGYSLEIGRMTDGVYDALTNSSDENAVREMSETSLIFGVDEAALPEYGYQQSPAFTATYPTRRPVELTEADSLAIAEAMTGWVMGTINARGQRIDPMTRRFAPGGKVI